MSHTDAARARWRADLREFGAGALDSAGLSDMAAEHLAEAASLRTYADLMVDLATAKEAFAAARDAVPFPTSHAGLDAYLAEVAALPEAAALAVVKDTVVAFRRNRRTVGPPTVGLVNNFSEPSDAELIALGY
jgi:hypothetical protein